MGHFEKGAWVEDTRYNSSCSCSFNAPMPEGFMEKLEAFSKQSSGKVLFSLEKAQKQMENEALQLLEEMQLYYLVSDGEPSSNH